MKILLILKKFCVICVCLSLLFTLGCNNNNKKSTTDSKIATTTKQTVSSSNKVSQSPTNTAVNTSTPSKSSISTNSYTPSRTGPFDGGFASDKPLLLKLYTGQGTGDEGDPYTAEGKTAIKLDDTIAGQFFATSNINYIETYCPSWSNDIGNITLSIYNWRGTYKDTISASAIKSLEFTDYADNSWLQLKFDKPLPAGEYLWVLSDPVEEVGIWDVPVGPVDHQNDVKCYVSGEVIDTYHIFRLQYEKTPNITLVELSK